MTKMLDCLVIGGGPAGLTAAIYLSRFLLSVRVVDAGSSRAALIPCTRNHAGFPDGISGEALIALMREQAARYGAAFTDGRVCGLRKDGEHFIAEVDGERIEARSVLLATGVVNNRPPIDEASHDAAVARGLLRYCPICDGYEVTDRRVAVIGTRTHGHNEAIFLRMYTQHVTLIAPDGAHALSDAEHAALSALDIAIHDGPCAPLEINDDGIRMSIPQGMLTFDSVYPALGSVINSELATGLGAQASGDGCLVVDPHQLTSVPGLYAAGDVTKGLDQISHAMGEAAVAATAIRNWIAERHILAR